MIEFGSFTNWTASGWIFQSRGLLITHIKDSIVVLPLHLLSGSKVPGTALFGLFTKPVSFINSTLPPFLFGNPVDQLAVSPSLLADILCSQSAFANVDIL